MACDFPWSQSLGSAVRPLACGRCRGCRLEYSRQWAVRLMHEASLHESNVFVTLTYADAPASLNYTDFPLFMRRLRRFAPGARFYMCGEYGDENDRPHYHGILFGVRFADGVYFAKSGSGEKIYTSATLSGLWPLGFANYGGVTFESCGYVARYVMKKLTGPLARADRMAEFCRMSRRPGIGHEWFERYGRTDVYPDGKVVVNGHKASAPKYYRRKIKARWPVKARELAAVGHEKIVESVADSSDERIRAKAAVRDAAMVNVRRKL